MPRPSREREVQLLTVEECAALYGKSDSTVRRAMRHPGAHVEYQVVTRADGSGASKVAFLDPSTLGFGPLPQGGNWSNEDDQLPGATGQGQLVTGGATGQVPETPAQTPETAESAQKAAGATGHEKMTICPPARGERTVDLASARTRLEKLQPILRLAKNKRAEAVAALARAENVSERSVYRWLGDLETGGVQALARKGREDRGKPRIPELTHDLIVGCLLSNPPATSAQMIHRTLLRAVPDAMAYSRGGEDVVVSPSTVQRVRESLLKDPHTRLLFYDATERREYLRTSTGTVMSNHANDLWEMDMTRCDVEVVNPETREYFRPRIHAIIDVYSGCIPGLAFSESEDQTQTDLTILRALLPKSGPFASKYPVFGKPLRMYWDNGKTYVSEQARRVIAGLDVLDLHSRPRVSHTRGKIERFFGTFHGYEKSFSSYVGENAVKRSSEELRELHKRTERWLDGGADPGSLKRHPTLQEYQNGVMAWLIAEYHATVLDGKTRLEHFTGTAPRASQVVFDMDELLLLFARREERVVTLDGGVKQGGQLWKIPDGTLAQYARGKVLVLEDQFLLSDRRLIVYPERDGRLRKLGEAVPAPKNAASIEAGDLCRAEKAVKKQALIDAREARERLADPELTVTRQLLKEAAVVIEPRPLPGPKARLSR